VPNASLPHRTLPRIGGVTNSFLELEAGGQGTPDTGQGAQDNGKGTLPDPGQATVDIGRGRVVVAALVQQLAFLSDQLGTSRQAEADLRRQLGTALAALARMPRPWTATSVTVTTVTPQRRWRMLWLG
jgi:hypothetical protein